ncbi:polymorphic toxin-type HINT domain-containing protein [Planctomyces sp. SH-PL62]|uniref:polymorphic toxin-type HINT domain-containing protein n=1 Tax=Planctomyces sp. SH-PL62 TaxID=1636152 RepID=UPI00078B40AB|nr:polymorphic toxin-type HINT domain-containing protein [Planctomyces sp. SH-PL62]AMV39995.1 hypothetical protein VT85_21355 [Planctomyces sp. SH-PL62]
MISAWFLGLAVGVVGGSDQEAPRAPAADRAAYEEARTRAGRDADAQVDLALWCEARGLAAEKTTHLTRAVLIDPDHARARGLLGYVRHEGRWMRPDGVSRAVEESPESQALLREYLDRRTRTSDDADDLYKLALWCEEKGLSQPMVAHLRRVVQLDPGREGAWRRLGFKKVSGRWIDPEAEAEIKAARVAQEQADKAWKPRLEKLRNALGSKEKTRRAEAQAELAAIDDPRAAAMVWQVFARGGDERRQRIAVDVYSRMDAPAASTALALIAVFSPHAGIRSDAATLLLRRDPREYAGLLAGLIQDEIKYKIKPVEGPGSQGELFVQGRDENVRRRYTPLQGPVLAPTDQLDRDENGRLIALRPTGYTYTGPSVGTLDISANGAARITTNGASSPFDGVTVSGGLMHVPTGVGQNAGLTSALQGAGLSASQTQTILGRLPQSVAFPVGGSWTSGSRVEPVYEERIQIPVEQMMAEARASALMARRQLESDVAQIEAQNAPRREVNERASAVLKRVSGADLGDDREKWMAWAVDLEGYVLPQKSASEPPPTYVEDVPIAFQPQATFTRTGSLLGYELRHSCFAGGTMVRTLQGLRAIESIRPGDQVLSQDTTTGKLDYRPVVTVYHNPPNETFKIDVGRETVHPTGIHRLWKAGRGWIMAREVQPGDRLRTVGGLVEVSAIEKESAQPVFNLLIAGGDSYCVGELGLIAHDNSFVDPVAKPFDDVPALASATSRP